MIILLWNAVEALLKRTDCDVNLAKKNGATALHIATYSGHADVVRALLNHPDCNVNLMRENGDSALHIAAIRGHTECARALACGGGLGMGRAAVRRAQHSGRR